VARVGFDLGKRSWNPIEGFASLESHETGKYVTAPDKRPYSSHPGCPALK
jgi:hypothetical protein